MFREIFHKRILRITGILRKYGYDLFVACGLFVLFYFPPLFSFGSIRINAVHVIGVCSILLLLWKGRFLKFLRVRENYYIVAGFFVLLVYGLLLISRHKTSYSQMSTQLYFLVDVIPFAFVAADYALAKKLKMLDCLNLFITIGMIQALSAVLAMLIPPLKNLQMQMLANYGYGDVIWISAPRMFGFSGQLTHATPVLQSFLAVIAFYLCFEESRSYYVPVFLLFGTAVFNARASIVVFGIGAILVLCCGRRWGKNHILQTLKIPLLMLPVVAAILVVLYLIMPTTVEWIWVGIKEIVGFVTGRDEDSVFTTLLSKEWLRLPSGYALYTGVGCKIINGYSNEAMGITHINSDVGYINDIWYGGIIYAVLLYSLFYYLMSRLIRGQDNKLLRFVGMFFMIIMPILNIKGLAFSIHGYANFIVILVVILVNNRIENRKVTKNGA